MARTWFPVAVAVGAAVLIGAGAQSVAGQAAEQRPPLVIPSLYGGDLYQFYCASCHGREGRGDGPVASSLKHQPPDLTTIAKRHDGRFPREATERYISGEAEAGIPPAHGSREMPVWGPILGKMNKTTPEERLLRICNLSRYLDSIQTK